MQWKVTDRDGTISTFKTIGALAGLAADGTSADLVISNKWLLASVVDMHDNAINYAYDCAELGQSRLTSACYPSTITYQSAAVSSASAVITFHREARPDFILMANGVDIAATKRRVKAISIKVGSTLRGAYALSYDQAPFSRASRLTAVDRYGTNATVAADGTVTAPTAKKRVGEFDYQGLTTGYVAGATGASIGEEDTYSASDFNSDGRDKLLGTKVIKTVTGGSGGDNGSESTTTRDYHRSIVSFGDTGAPLNTSNFLYSTQASTNGNSELSYDRFLFMPGRFDAGKRDKDYAYTKVIAQTQNGGDGDIIVVGHDTSNSILKVSGLQFAAPLACASATASYAAVCQALPPEGHTTGANPPMQLRWERFVADFDGDGIETLYQMNGPAPTDGPTARINAGLADFQGNGKPRFLTYDGRKAQFASGAWQYSGTSIDLSVCQTSSCVFADVNGDGAADVLTGRGPGQSPLANFAPRIFLSTGNSFKVLTIWTVIPGGVIVADFDNDGKADLLTVTGSSSKPNSGASGTLKVFSFFSNLDQPGNHLIELAWSSPPRVSRTVGDFNGDGLPDFMNAPFIPGGEPASSYLVSNPGPGNPNLLRSATNELGGVSSIEYGPSPSWSNGYLPQVMHAVTKLSANDGRGQIAETKYAYSGGKYDPKARKFLGYQTVTETKPLANGETAPPTVVTTYRQDLASYGLPAMIQHKDGAGVVHKQIGEVWEVNTAAKPYWAKNTRTDTALTEGGASTTLRVTRSFDEWGNLVAETDLGRTDIAGDEKLTRRFFTPNTAAFITSLPRVEKVYASVDGDGNPVGDPVKWTNFIYDGAADASVAPTKGDVTKIVRYLSVNPTMLGATETFTYDPQGNRLSAVDGAGNRTEWTYDLAYKLYPSAERLPKYFANGALAGDTDFQNYIGYTTIGFACGKPSLQTDINDIDHSYTYDPFCRLTREQNGTTGHYRAIAYNNEGNPSAQHIAVSEPLPNSAGLNTVKSYFDGRGRVWKESSNGYGTVTRDVLTEYDRRGNVAQKSHPFYTDSTARYTSTTYDWNDRPLKITNPDNSTRSYSYGIDTDVTQVIVGVVTTTYTQMRDELLRDVR